MSIRLFAVVMAAAAAGYVAGARKDFRAELMEADRAFDRTTAEKRSDGWVAFFHGDGKMVRQDGRIVEGPEQIREQMDPLFSVKENSLRWAPDFAEASKSGDLGYTVGTSKLRFKYPKGEWMERDGRYVTIWRRGPDGQWKVALDIGSGGQPKPVQP
ncbi:MAG: DUF4440 domain-containing protein [Bryobacterales bacterium]|nr:DUF4440 domain-containing protein [Bryobacterales bacterium]